MATGSTDEEDRRANTTATTTTRVSTGSADEHGFTEEWVRTHASRAAQRQLEVHDNPHGTPRTRLHQQDEEEREEFEKTHKNFQSQFFFQFFLFQVVLNWDWEILFFTAS